MKRPRQRAMRVLSAAERRTVAARARYSGSAEHKVQRWWGGLPEARQLPGGRIGRQNKQTTTVCPLTTAQDRDRATQWIRSAIMEAQYRFYESDQEFPKKVWYEADGQTWIGYCVNRTTGEYKGWPIDDGERRAIFG